MDFLHNIIELDLEDQKEQLVEYLNVWAQDLNYESYQNRIFGYDSYNYITVRGVPENAEDYEKYLTERLENRK